MTQQAEELYLERDCLSPSFSIKPGTYNIMSQVNMYCATTYYFSHNKVQYTCYFL